jgi:hypothetical protein
MLNLGQTLTQTNSTYDDVELLDVGQALVPGQCPEAQADPREQRGRDCNAGCAQREEAMH